MQFEKLIPEPRAASKHRRIKTELETTRVEIDKIKQKLNGMNIVINWLSLNKGHTKIVKDARQKHIQIFPADSPLLDNGFYVVAGDVVRIQYEELALPFLVII